MLEDSIEDYNVKQSELRENNSKLIQVSLFTSEAFTQNETKTKVDCGTQCKVKFFTSSSTQYDISDFNHENDDKFDLSFQSTSKLDETFVSSSDTTSSESEYNVSNLEYADTLRKPRTDAFILFSKLFIHFFSVV